MGPGFAGELADAHEAWSDSGPEDPSMGTSSSLNDAEQTGSAQAAMGGDAVTRAAGLVRGKALPWAPAAQVAYVEAPRCPRRRTRAQYL